MASLFRRPNSPYWFAAYTSAKGERLKKSTKQLEKSAALVVLSELLEAERQAKAKSLTEAQARRLISEILERTTGETIQFHSCREWLDEWCTSKTGSTATRTSEKYKQVCRDFVEHLADRAELALSAITPKDVRSFRDALLQSGLSPSTVNQTVRKVLISPFAAAQRLGYIQTNPCSAVEALKDDQAGTRDIFTEEQVGRLVNAAEGDWKGVIIAAYYTGLRLRDITDMSWHAIDFEKCTLQVKTRKTGTVVVIPLHAEFTAWLKQQERRNGKAPIFRKLVSIPGTGRNGLSMQFRRIMSAAGVKSAVLREKSKEGGAGRKQHTLTFHSLRHSFVSALANAGVSPELRQQLAGHTDDRSHARYTHHELETLRAAVLKLPKLSS